VESKWLPKLTQYSRGKRIPFIIVGNKVDLREAKKCTCQPEPCNSESHFIQEKEGEELAKKMEAMAYVEACSVNGRGIGITFGYILDMVLHKIDKECHTCGVFFEDHLTKHECSKCYFNFCDKCTLQPKDGETNVCKRCSFAEQTTKLLAPLEQQEEPKEIEEEVQLRHSLDATATTPTANRKRRSISMDFKTMADWIPKIPPRAMTPSPWKGPSITASSSSNGVSKSTSSTLSSHSRAKSATISSKSVTPQKTSSAPDQIAKISQPASKKTETVPTKKSTLPEHKDTRKKVKLLEEKIQLLLQAKSKASENGEEDKATYLLEQVGRLQDQLSELHTTAVWR